MDHHCPWINTCVGHFNHGHFVSFLASAVLGCGLATISLSLSLYYGLNRFDNQLEFCDDKLVLVLRLKADSSDLI